MRTFNDIVPPSRRKEMEPFPGPVTPGDEPPIRPPVEPRGSRFPYATLLAILLVIGLSIGALFYFSSAKIEITPSSVGAAVQGSFTAGPNNPLTYEVITAQKVASQSVKSTGSKAVSSLASGTITITNNQSKSQPLVANTRFATPSGLIFRIKTGTTVPKNGSVAVKVYADQPGSQYNIGPTSFTVPGFKGTPQEGVVTGKSASAMTGGASGNVATIDPGTAAQTKATLTKALEPELLNSIKSQVPSGYTLLSGSATTTYEELPPTPSDAAGMVDMKVQGTVKAVVFPNQPLAKAIATGVAGLHYQGEPLILSSGSKLILSTPEVPESNDTTFSFAVSGTADFIYDVDPTRIQAAVSGKTRSGAEVALTNYPEVKRAVIILRPFWRGSFPQDPSSITVIVNTPK